MTAPTLLLVAKAPVPGLAKTRIAATTGDVVAAELAAASMLDTLETVLTASRETGCPVVVSLTGDLDRAARGTEISAALADVSVVPQRGGGLDERLAHAHADADRGHGVVQVGMDTPQLTCDDYTAAVDAVRKGVRVLGPAEDGGWWLLGLPDAAEATALVGVPMSSADTAEVTARAFEPIERLRVVADMDTWADALRIATDLPCSRVAAVVEGAR